MNDSNNKVAIIGCLLGTSVGDAIGLPAEGLSREKAQRFCRGGLRHRLVFGRGMFSDDTEHTLMLAVALGKHPEDAAAFQRMLGWSLRWWMLALPAGVGLSTAKAIGRLWLGFPTSRSGVRSAGNGAAMRSAVIGVFFRDDMARRRKFALAACRLTHTDARAEESSVLVAEAASLVAGKAGTPHVLAALRELIVSPEMKSRWALLEEGLSAEWSVMEYADRIGCERGVTGFAPNTVAVALFAWLRHRGDFRRVISEVIGCGGDTDTVAAISGAICGAESGEAGIPAAWIEGVADWPRSIGYVHEVARALADRGGSVEMPSLQWWAIPFRNAFFLFVVLGHGFRRLIPNFK